MTSTLTGITKKEWDAICDGCGKCCAFVRTDESGTKGRSNIACPGLNVLTNRCTVYKDRHSKHMCISLRPDNVMSLHERNVLPDSCAYVRRAQEKPPLEVIEEAVLIPFYKADLKTRRKYEVMRKKWMRQRKAVRNAIKTQRP
jgi:uncharacterized cysteine cluster protein YcgN (CxxCxxCC family)